MTELPTLRRDYARRMLSIAGVEDPAVERALATVPRENFLGDGPWTILVHDPDAAALTLADHDPAPLYDDVLVVLDAAQGINNGSPSLHARMLHHLGVREGDRVLHIGAGTGYYTAMLAELSGPGGRVTAIEYDPQLAASASANLRPWPNVNVHTGDGADWPTSPVERIYVNFALPAPAAAWLDNLTDGGTLVLPIGVIPGRGRSEARRGPGAPVGGKSVGGKSAAGNPVGGNSPGGPGTMSAPVPGHATPGGAPVGNGAVLALTRAGTGIAVRHVSSCAFIFAEGALAGTPALRDSLSRAFNRGGIEFVRSYRRPPPASPDRCWFWSPDWAFCYDEPGASGTTPAR